MSAGCSRGKPTSRVCNPGLRVCDCYFGFYSPEAASKPSSHRRARAASYRSAQSSRKEETRPKIPNFGCERRVLWPAMAAAGRHRPDGKGWDGPRPCGTCAPRSAARREREGKGRVGRREERGGEGAAPGSGTPGRGQSCPGRGSAGLCAQPAPRRGGVGGEGTGSASPRRWAVSGRGVPAPCPGQALPKRPKKRKAVIKVAAAARSHPPHRPAPVADGRGQQSRAPAESRRHLRRHFALAPSPAVAAPTAAAPPFPPSPAHHGPRSPLPRPRPPGE